MSQKIAFTPSQIIRSANHARENNEPFLQVCPVADKPKICICTSITETRANTSAKNKM